MPDVSRVEINNIVYDLKDEELRRQLDVLLGIVPSSDDKQSTEHNN